jgi:hypothetical protein
MQEGRNLFSQAEDFFDAAISRIFVENVPPEHFQGLSFV